MAALSRLNIVPRGKAQRRKKSRSDARWHGFYPHSKITPLVYSQGGQGAFPNFLD